MSTQTLSIRRLSVTTRLAADGAAVEDRVSRLLRGVAEYRLDRALAAADLPDGTWCVRRLDVPVRLDLDLTDGALASAWASTLVSAVVRALASGSPDVVRYRGDLDALADLLSGAATGRTERAWAWSRLGLRGSGDPSVASDPGAAIIAALRRRPMLAMGAVRMAVRRVGLLPVHRALGPAGWVAVAGIVAAAADVGAPPVVSPAGGPVPAADGGAHQALARALMDSSPLAELIRRSRLRADPNTAAGWALLVVADADSSVLHRTAAPQVLSSVAATLTDSPQHVLGSAPAASRTAVDSGRAPTVDRHKMHPDEANAGTVDNDRVDADGFDPDTVNPGTVNPDTVDSARRSYLEHGNAGRPGRPPRAEAADPKRLPEAVSGGTATPRRSTPARAPGQPPHPPVAFGATGTIDRKAAGAAGGQTAAPTPIPRLEPDTHADPDEQRSTHPTEWAGLLFLLATAAYAGVPDRVVDEVVFASRPLPWILHGVALGLGLPPNDPAVTAFTGTDPSETPIWKTDWTPTPAESHRLAEITQRWVTVTAAALEAPDAAAWDVVIHALRRRGLIRYEPGWIDIELELDQVDIAVRKAGLDLDPGWVPWLGKVVRFVYV